jgi:hypothetical protein
MAVMTDLNYGVVVVVLVVLVVQHVEAGCDGWWTVVKWKGLCIVFFLKNSVILYHYCGFKEAT